MSERVKKGDRVRIVLADDGGKILGVGRSPLTGTVVSMPRGAGDTACIHIDHGCGPVEFNLNGPTFIALVKEPTPRP